MAKLNVFNFITLNGFYKGPNNDINWHKHGGEDETQFSDENSQGAGILLFGRVTYEMMASYWPTPMAEQQNPGTAKGMNAAEKVVFSRSIKKAGWQNTTVLNGNLEEEVKKLKQGSKPITILGSGSLVTQLADAGLIDEFQIMLDPTALGDGTPMFKGLHKQLDLKLKSSRAFKSGAVLLNYEV